MHMCVYVWKEMMNIKEEKKRQIEYDYYHNTIRSNVRKLLSMFISKHSWSPTHHSRFLDANTFFFVSL